MDRYTALVEAALLAGGAAFACRRFAARTRHTDPSFKVVVVTGCDSGLGWAFARRALADGLTVVAGFLQGKDSKPALLLASGTTNRSHLHCVTLDITDDQSVKDTVKYVEELILSNSKHQLHALVNNAGVMTFGEFEWLTPSLINHHINVNIIGTMRITQAFLPLLRNSVVGHQSSAPRVVNVTSHCALQPLPKLSVYCATKAALRSWTDSIRLENKKYGLQVVNFIPGSFFLSSNISARQQQQAAEMRASLTDEQKSVFGEYFERLMHIFSQMPVESPPDALEDALLMDKFSSAILDLSPKLNYIHQPWRYTLYHLLFRIPMPVSLKDWLVFSFMKLPRN